MKKDQVCVADVEFSADSAWTAKQLAELIENSRYKLSASDGLVLTREQHGERVRVWRARISYRAKGANTEDIEKRFEKVFGRRPHAERVGVFHLVDTLPGEDTEEADQ